MKLQGEDGKRWTDCDYRKGLKRRGRTNHFPYQNRFDRRGL